MCSCTQVVASARGANCRPTVRHHLFHLQLTLAESRISLFSQAHLYYPLCFMLRTLRPARPWVRVISPTPVSRSTRAFPSEFSPTAVFFPGIASRRWFLSDVNELKLETGVNDSDESAEVTGVMDYLKLTEALIFFDNVYPRWRAKLWYSRLFGWVAADRAKFSDSQLKERVCNLIHVEGAPLPQGTVPGDFVPLKRDGGAFVKFQVPLTTSVKELTKTIEKNCQENRRAHERSIWHYFTPWINFPRAYHVKGTPWIEDMSRFPSSKLKVIFEGNALTEEELYVLFRRYGAIVDIVPLSGSVSYATVIFKMTDACIRAKNCITGIALNEGKTTLHLQYIPIERVNYITNFIGNHQRIAIPVILAILAAIAVFIFEPIRLQFIQFKIQSLYSWDAHKDNLLVKAFYIPYRMIVSSISDGRHFLDDSLESLIGGKRESADLEDLEKDFLLSERNEKANQMKLWICENANTFIIVRGPKGSGKREFVFDHTIKMEDTPTKNVLEIDCAALVNARSENLLLKATAGQVGYFPLFTWTNSITQFIDLGLQGLTGQKSGFNETKETQFKNILLLTQVAIRQVALADFSAYKCDLERQQQKKLDGGDGDFKYSEIREEEYLQMHPEAKPVVVVSNYAYKSDSPNDFTYAALAEWGAQLIQTNVAHVVFITQDSGSILHLTKALPNQVFKSISLSDASYQASKQFVVKQLRDDKVALNVDKCLAPLGGRMLDLQAFVRRIRSGEDAEHALQEMILQAAEQITTFFLIPGKQEADATWTTAQIWALMRCLSKSEEIEFIDLVKSPLFALTNATVATLSALEKNDLVRLKREKGIIRSITTGRPLYRAAFENLVNDNRAFKLYETDFYKSLISLENAKISLVEDEISKVSSLHDLRFVKERLDYLSKKLNASTVIVEEYEQKVKEVGKIPATSTKKNFLGF